MQLKYLDIKLAYEEMCSNSDKKFLKMLEIQDLVKAAFYTKITQKKVMLTSAHKYVLS